MTKKWEPYKADKSAKNAFRTLLTVLVPVVVGGSTMSEVDWQTVITLGVIPLVSAAGHMLVDWIRYGPLKGRNWLPLGAVLLALSVGPGCQTSLNQPIPRENIELIVLTLNTAQQTVRWGVEEYRAAAVANDDARLQQAQRRIDIALDTIVRTNELLGRNVDREEAFKAAVEGSEE